MDRVILHCDCNSFFASVECVAHPELKDKPMIVGGSQEDRHGIVLAKNEPAKKYGIVTAETIWQAKKKCPGLIIVPPHYERYAYFSREINKIYSEYTDLVEPFGIDESWLDVTGSTKLFGSGEHIADELRRRIRETFGLTVSVGVSFNKVFAKLGSDYKKPDATTVISRENYTKIVFPLSVSDLLFAGKHSAQALRQMGIYTIGELARTEVDRLVARLGKAGKTLWEYANGIDDSPVTPVGYSRDIKSVGRGLTFKEDLTNKADIHSAIIGLSDSVASRLRRYGKKCRTIQLTVRACDMKSFQRQKSISVPVNTAADIACEAFRIAEEVIPDGMPVRMMTVTATSLINSNEEQPQIPLFETEEEVRKRQRLRHNEKLETAMDIIRAKYGKDSVGNAGRLKKGISGNEDDDSE